MNRNSRHIYKHSKRNIQETSSQHQTNKQKTMIISLDAKKAFDKIQEALMIKVKERPEIQDTYINIVKEIYKKPVVNIKLNREKLEAIH